MVTASQRFISAIGKVSVLQIYISEAWSPWVTSVHTRSYSHYRKMLHILHNRPNTVLPDGVFRDFTLLTTMQLTTCCCCCCCCSYYYYYYYYYYYIYLTAFFRKQPGQEGTRKVNHSVFYWSKRWWGGSGISWTICKSFAPHSRQTHASTSPLSSYRPDALPAAQSTASKYWRHNEDAVNRLEQMMTKPIRLSNY